MTPDQITQANADLRQKPALDIIKWAIAQAGGRAIVSTNYRPYEAVILHLVTQVQPDIPVLWVDHGYNRAATYRHAEEVKRLLKLNIKAYLPEAHRRALRRGSRRHAGADAGERRADQGLQHRDEAGALSARHEGTGADRLDHRAAQSAEPQSRRPRHRRRTTAISIR